MGSDKDHIKEIFSSKLSNFEPDLPEFIWDKIDTDLSNKSVVKKIPIRKKIYRIATTVAAVAAVILIVLYLLPQQELEVINPLVDKSVEHVFSKETLHTDEKTVDTQIHLLAEGKRKSNGQTRIQTIYQNSQNLVTDRTLDEDTINKHSVDEILDVTPLSDSKTLVAEANANIEVEALKIDAKSFEADLNKQIIAFESKGKELDNLLSSTDALDKEKTSSNKGFQLGLGGGSGFSKANDTKSQLNALHQGSNGVTLRSSKVKLKHNQPIIFGVGLSKRITNKISLENMVLTHFMHNQQTRLGDADNINKPRVLKD